MKPNDPEDPLNKQNIRDRYDGKNDPVAQKILSRFKKQQEEAEKQLKKVCTLYLWVWLVWIGRGGGF